MARTALYVDPNGDVIELYALEKYDGGGAQASVEGMYWLTAVGK